MKKALCILLLCLLALICIIAPQANAASMEPRGETCVGYESYKAYISKYIIIPIQFVRWEQAESLGECKEVYIEPYYLSFAYSIVDSNENLIKLIAEPANVQSLMSSTDLWKDASEIAIPEGMTNMLIYPGDLAEAVIIKRGGLSYYYSQYADRLIKIRWEFLGWEFTLGIYGVDDPSSYTNPIIQGLLSVDDGEFKAARNKLLWNMMFTKTETVLICVVPVVLTAGIIIAVTVVRKKKKAAGIAPPTEEPAE